MATSTSKTAKKKASSKEVSAAKASIPELMTEKVARPAKPLPAIEAANAAARQEADAAKKTSARKKSANKPPPSKAASKKKATPSLPGLTAHPEGTAQVLDSRVVYEGPLFRVLNDHLIEPSGRESHRDVIRHNGSVVILAIDHGGKSKKQKKNPWVVVERQYRHAAGQYLWELPAGKLDAGEAPLEGAKRELAEETGYSARKWTPLIDYYASPGFLGEAMKIFVAEGLVAGDAHPEEDEHIDFRLVRLDELLNLIDKREIIDGKTLSTILLYARQLGLKGKKKKH